MRKFSVGVIAGLSVLISILKVKAQEQMGPASVIAPYYLEIGVSKTTNIIFPFAIKSFDRGSKDVLAQKAIGAENILQVKAGRKNFEQTNVTVVTADGRLFSFLLRFSEDPSVINLQFGNETKQQGLRSGSNLIEGELREECRHILDSGKPKAIFSERKDGITLDLKGLYIRADRFYFHFTITNISNIGYSVSQFRFFQRDKKLSKRTAVQEIELEPIYRYRDTTTIPAKSRHSFIMVLPKNTIPDQKILVVQLMEENGGRNLEIILRNKHLLNARPIQ